MLSSMRDLISLTIEMTSLLKNPALQDADINAEYDHSAGSDGEGEEGEEAIEETRPSKASGSKEQPQFVSSDAEETSSSGADSTSEEDSADSDSCEGAIEEDRPVPFMPSLDFNLAGGVSKLLSGEVGMCDLYLHKYMYLH